MRPIIILGLVLLIACNHKKTEKPTFSEHKTSENPKISENTINREKSENPFSFNDGDPSKIITPKRDSIEKLIKEANEKFLISDSAALEKLLKVQEIKDIRNKDYQDSTIFNSLTIIGITEKKWEIDMGQFQKGLDKYYSFIRFWVDATDGKIEVLDLDYGVDDPIELNEWLKLKTADKR